MTDASPVSGSDLVLLAEDNDSDVVLFKRAWAAAGIHTPVQTVPDGEQAIDYLKGEGKFGDRSRHPLPKLLILDLKMPRKSGFEVMEWVRGQSDFRELRIAVLTTSGDLSDVKKAYQAGASTFLTKSMDPQDFAAQLKGIKNHWL